VKAGEVDALVTVLADDQIFALFRAAFIHFTEKFHNVKKYSNETGH
jgi:hypothetical protein